MEFTLYYRGELKANRGPADKQMLRRHFHLQLAQLWKEKPLNEQRSLLGENAKSGDTDVRQHIGAFVFAPLVCEKLNMIAEVNVTLLRPEPPGSILTQGGDIDNRLKTLFDALKIPSEPTALPKGDAPSAEETPFFCLLEDDNLITKVTVKTDRLLDDTRSKSEVVLLIHVITKTTRSSWANIGLG